VESHSILEKAQAGGNPFLLLKGLWAPDNNFLVGHGQRLQS